MPLAPTPCLIFPTLSLGGRGGLICLSFPLPSPPLRSKSKFSAPRHGSLPGKVTLDIARRPELEVEVHLIS